MQLEKRRELRRKKGRVAYDCFNLKYREDGRVYCAKGNILGQAKDKSFSLELILRGITPSICKRCELFEGD